MSPTSICGYSSSSSPPDQSTPQRSRGERHTDMAELAKHVSELNHTVYKTLCIIFLLGSIEQLELRQTMFCDSESQKNTFFFNIPQVV